MTDLGWVRDTVARGSTIRGSCSFVGGSAARGWANAGSDIDVYVLGCDEDRAEIVDTLEGRPAIDVHALSEATLEQLFSRVSWDIVSAGKNFVGTFSEREWLVFERIHHAYPLEENEVIADYQARLADSAHRYMLIQEHFGIADGHARDCLGQLDIGDDDSAVLSGRTAALRAIDGLLTAHGCYTWNPKWRARAMGETKPDLLNYDDFWQVVTFVDLPQLGHREWSRRQVALARDLMSRVDVIDFTRVLDA